MLLRCAFALVLITGLAGCSQFPQLDESLSEEARKAKYPELVPVEELTARAEQTQITDETLPGIEARVARLKARAARLRRTVLDGTSRARLSQSVE